MKKYPTFRKENVPAYLAVLLAWVLISCCSAALLSTIVNSISFIVALIWALPSVMAGMAIMFVASVLNLRKLTPGFRRLAEGQQDPGIPPVWCPVLTAATNAALELSERVHNSDSQSARRA